MLSVEIDSSWSYQINGGLDNSKEETKKTR